MSQYVVLEQNDSTNFSLVSEKPVEARTSQDALKKHLAGKPAPELPLVPIPVRHFQPVEVEVEQVAPRITIKTPKRTTRKKG